jgi:hypothetical protein
MVPHPPELRHERVVAETISAVHAPGAGCDLDDIQAADLRSRKAESLSEDYPLGQQKRRECLATENLKAGCARRTVCRLSK